MSKIIRDKNTNYSIIGNQALRDITLSARSKGIYAYLMTLPEDWVLYKSELYKHFIEGRDAIETALRELMKAGYLEMAQGREAGKFGGQDFLLHDSPFPEKPSTEKPLTVKPAPENPQLLITDELITDKSKNLINNREIDFQTFWEFYPNKVNKKKALSAWKNCKTLPDPMEHLAIIEKWRSSEQWRNGYIPHPTTWINGERWNDQLPIEAFDFPSLPEELKHKYIRFIDIFDRDPQTANELKDWKE